MTKETGTPQIRFSGYNDTWEQRKVQDVADRFDNLRIPVAANLRVHGTTPYYGANGIQDFVEGFTHDGEFVLVAEDGANDLKNYPVKCVNGRIWVNNHAHVLQGKAGITDNSFLAFAISQSDIESLLVGGGRAKLNAETLMSIEFRLPCLPEQYRIGEYLTQLDHLITLHQRKYNKLVKVKKSMLEKMFPREGAKVPEIRFYGFTDDWEQRKVSDLGNIVTGSTPPTKDKSNYDGEFLFVSPADIQGNRYVTNTITTLTEQGFNKGRILKEKSTLFVSIGSTIGKVAQTLEKSTTNQQINAIEPYCEFDEDFVFTLMEKTSGQIKSLAATQAVPIVNKTSFGEVEINVPLDIAEQIKIGVYFRNLDNLITLHQRKLEKLKNLKKACLKKMFI